MFVPVACSQCGKPFQVPEAAVGGPTVCPWCQATVPALPVGTPVAPPAENRGPTPPARPEPPAPEPLPLDDLPPPAAPKPPASWLRRGLIGAAVLSLLVAVGVATVAVLRYKQGHVIGMEWKTFAAPDGSCSVELLGRPAEDTATEPGERRYVSEGWYSGTTTWVGWRDLTQVQVQLAQAKDGWVQLMPLFEAERDHWKSKYGGTVAREGTRFEANAVAHEVRLDSPQVRVAERMVVMPNGPRPRVYFVGMAGRFDPDGPEARRLFDSLRVNE